MTGVTTMYALHPHLAWAPANDHTIEAIHQPDGQPVSITGAAATMFLDIAEGLDPVAEAINRWDAPEDLIRAGAEPLLASLAAQNLIVPSEQPEAEQSTQTAEESPIPTPYEVLFVCTANICRSAYAAAYARGVYGDGIEFHSAGTHALVGQEMDPPMATHLANRGLGSAHAAQQLTREVAQQADLIITMTGEHRDFILDEWPDLARRTFVIGQATRELQEVTDDVTLDGLTRYLWRHRSYDPRDSVIDPYGQGDEAAATTARLIDSQVNAVVAALTKVATSRG